MVSVTVTSAELKWCPPKGTAHSYQISYSAGGTESEPIETNNCSTIIPNLKPCTNYKISVRTKLNDGRISVPAETDVQTGENRNMIPGKVVVLVYMKCLPLKLTFTFMNLVDTFI